MSWDELIRDPEKGQALKREDVGGKAAQLGELRAKGAKVPRFLALRAEAHERGRSEGLAEALKARGFGGRKLAVRSSGLAEDGAQASFAGQFESVLNVSLESLPEALQRVWDSARGERALAYSGGHPMRLGVVIQEMVEATAAGVAFCADPVSGDLDTMVISAVPGLGEALVSGESDADTWHLRGSQIRSECKGDACLSEKELRSMAVEFRRLEREFGVPQDFEWALGPERELYLLQARPITTLAQGEIRIWDNSNIVESFSGLTLPLTFSYAQMAYEEAYKVFARILGVSERDIREHRELFSERLGLIHGHVYYNLICWYKSLSYLPGYRLNQSFMEKMMGLREPMPLKVVADSSGSAWGDFWRVLKASAGLLFEFWGIENLRNEFQKRMDRVLGPYETSGFETENADELLAAFHRMERELLGHWRAPLSNDFFAMLYFGLLSGLLAKWKAELPASSVNDLLCGEGGIISTEPTRLLSALARRIQAEPSLFQLFSEKQNDFELWTELPGPFRAELEAYLKRFGARCAMELKLETIPLDEDPPALLAVLRGYLVQKLKSEEELRNREAKIRAAAEKNVFSGLGFIRALILKHVLRQARRLVRNRENLRFERTRSFAVVRRLFSRLGRIFHQGELLEAPRDIFYLAIPEIFGAIQAQGLDSDLKEIVRRRKLQYEAFAQDGEPRERFSTRGPLSLARIPLRKEEARTTAPSGSLQGLACCPGIVRAKVRLVKDPREAGELKGRILVAERTDPGWTVLFPAAEGLLVERGSLLSHSAIVARELGLPCIVSVPNLMQSLRDGEEVEMDGSSGIIRRLELAPA